MKPKGAKSTLKLNAKMLAVHPAYNDHANVTEQWVLHLLNDKNGTEASRNLRATLRTSWSEDLFPVKLHAMLEKLSFGIDPPIISWLPHGRSFKVFQKEKFVQEVLPVYFGGQTQYASFQRQLNIYGFVQLSGQRLLKGSYYHECCLRGRPMLCRLMRRPKTATKSVRQSFDPNSEPDFDRMPALANHNDADMNVPIAMDVQLHDSERRPMCNGTCIPSITAGDHILGWTSQQASSEERESKGHFSSRDRSLSQGRSLLPTFADFVPVEASHLAFATSPFTLSATLLQESLHPFEAQSLGALHSMDRQFYETVPLHASHRLQFLPDQEMEYATNTGSVRMSSMDVELTERNVAWWDRKSRLSVTAPTLVCNQLPYYDVSLAESGDLLLHECGSSWGEEEEETVFDILCQG